MTGIKVIIGKTIKRRIMTIIIILLIVIAFIIYGISYLTYKNLLKENLIESAGLNLKVTMKNIENNIEEIKELATWCTVNSTISKYVSDAPDNISGLESINSYYRVKEEILNSQASRFLNRLIISNDKNALLQIVADSRFGSFQDGEVIKNLPYFNELFYNENFNLIGIDQDPFMKNKEQLIIPIIRPIYGKDNKPQSGWVYISVNINIITDYLNSYNFKNDMNFYISIGDKTYSYDGSKLVEDNYITDNLVDEENIDTFISIYKVKYNGVKREVIKYKSSIDDLTIHQVLPVNNFFIDKNAYFPLFIIITFVLIILAISISIMFNKMINEPISRINKRLLLISSGDFSYDKTIVNDDEIGSIGKGVNLLCKNIKELINAKLDYENQKKNLEFKMLQNQINPHFLYNTLNSIKWMATIQGATGISEMTTSLSRLLKNISKGTDELITIEEELDLLNEYIVIQQYRYGGSITVNYYIQSQELKKCYIIKFTLQPIIENAIFHGIEPKGSQGKIDINIAKINEEDILIEVIDNGIGMNEDIINKILKHSYIKSSKSFNNIGIKNVDDRIKLAFGNKYGITINSELNVYTNMKILLPYKLVKEKK